MLRRSLALAVAVAVAATFGAATPAHAAEADLAREPPAESSKCRHGQWAKQLDGKPAGLQARSAEGFYLWRTDRGFKLRVTHPDRSKLPMTGTITGGAITAWAKRSQSPDATVTADGRGITFSFLNRGALEGVDFRMACAPSLTLAVSIAGAPARPDQILLGKAATHAQPSSTTISRVKKKKADAAERRSQPPPR